MIESIGVTENTSAVMTFTRGYLALFYTLVAAFYTIRIIVGKRSAHAELVHPGERYCASWWNHMTFRVFRVVIWLVCVCRYFFPATDSVLGRFTLLNHPEIILSGDLLLALGFSTVIVIHTTMGNHWRSGIDNTGPKKLITHGFFRYSRNPIFLAVACAQVGFFLALPSVFTLICLLVGLYILHRQVLCEESHLLRMFQQDYVNYTLKTGRWL